VRETLLDYLRTTFSFSFADPAFEDALFAFLDGPNGLFRGPFVDLRLPFRKAPTDAPLPLEIRPSFRPSAASARPPRSAAATRRRTPARETSSWW
jgi:hypothetical protein